VLLGDIGGGKKKTNSRDFFCNIDKGGRAKKGGNREGEEVVDKGGGLLDVELKRETNSGRGGKGSLIIILKVAKGEEGGVPGRKKKKDLFGGGDLVSGGGRKKKNLVENEKRGDRFLEEKGCWFFQPISHT